MAYGPAKPDTSYDTPSYQQKASQLTPKMQEALTALMTGMNTTYPQYDWGMAQGQRSIDEQNKLYNQGSSVTKAKGGRSFHNYGLAADIYPSQGGQIQEYGQAQNAYEAMGKMAKSLGLMWGGSPEWKGPKGDYGHVNLNVPAPWIHQEANPLGSFSQAFGMARKAGLKSFVWNGQHYTTEMQ